jgi:catecholate siderophore receptor
MQNRTLADSFLKSRRRRRGTARLFVLSTAIAASVAPSMVVRADAQQGVVLVSAQGAVAQAAPMTFAIPPGSIDTVIAEFQRVTGLRVVLADRDLATIQSPGASGALTPRQAMEAMLMGTSIGASFSGDMVTLDVRGVNEFVAVRAQIAAPSSPRYVAPLREIPQTIAVVQRETIEAQGATTLAEALRNVPGVTLQAGEGGGAASTAGDMFNLRGFNAANSMFVDNVRDDGLVARDVFNLEQVEVFMGPTGSDVGRTTAAGYVNMQSKTPHLGSSTSGLIGFGTAGQARTTADFNYAFPQTGSWLSASAVRVNVLWQDSGVPGRDHAQLNSRAIAPSVAFGIGTPTRLTLAGQSMRQDNMPDYGVPGAAWLDEPLAPTTVRASAPVDQANFYGSLGLDSDKGEQDNVTVRFEHDVNRQLTLRNQTRYNRAHREAIVSAVQNVAAFDPTTNLVTIARQGSDRENTILSNQTGVVHRFQTSRLRHAVSAGLELTRETQFAPALVGLGTRAPADIFSPNPNEPVIGFAPAHGVAFTDGATNTIAVYAFDTIDLSAKVQVTGGVRVERYDTEFTSVATTAVRTDLAANDTLTSGKAGVLYRLSPTANLYASVGTAVTPPGSANFTLSAQANNVNSPSVEPQRSINYEVGTKWDLSGGRLSMNAAVFRTDNRNVIYTLDATTIPPLFNQDDEQRVQGVTIGVMGRVTDRWELLWNFGYLDSEQRSQSPTNGLRLVLTPEFSGSLWTTYNAWRGLTFGGGVRHTGEVFVNTANTIRTPGLAVVDALAEYAVNSHLSLRLNIFNLTDEVYVRNVNNNGGRYNPSNSRSAMITSNLRF